VRESIGAKISSKSGAKFFLLLGDTLSVKDYSVLESSGEVEKVSVGEKQTRLGKKEV